MICYVCMESASKKVRNIPYCPSHAPRQAREQTSANGDVYRIETGIDPDSSFDLGDPFATPAAICNMIGCECPTTDPCASHGCTIGNCLCL
jgi:hypothetical protein